MERNKKKQKRVLSIVVLLLLVVGISVGYAALSQTLSINGNATLTNATWNVYWTNVQITPGSVTATTPPSASGTTTRSISYTITLPTPGTFYEFTVEAKNGGSIPAKIGSDPTVSITGVSTAQDVYTNYTVTDVTSTAKAPAAGDTLAAGGTRKYKVRVEFDNSISSSQLPTTAQRMDLVFNIPWVQG